MRALLLVDIQNDFLPGGALGVSDGDQILPVVEGLRHQFSRVIATQDWHPADHGSFAANHPGKEPGDEIELGGVPQILWPVHCVQGSAGAELAPGLGREGLERIFRKGTRPQVDSYSAFFDNAEECSTGLGEYLRETGVEEVWIAGLATDYCVLFSVLDARRLGFRVRVVAPACRGVELRPGDSERAFVAMAEAGARVLDEVEAGALVLDGLGVEA